MSDKQKRFREPIRKNQEVRKDADAFINGDVSSQSNEEVQLEWYEALEATDKTKSSEKPVHINLNEYYREWGTKIAELDPQFSTRKHLCQVLIAEGMNKLIEKILKEQTKKEA
ncbi:conserved hypothetical protein [Vibrio nigripulchritudo SOn1]|uniref:Phage protein n=1 Tax=Vibrio nigripulchritudo SOn1 TaxID=1238450 RepID=A0AAV2VPM1_9VIBR|nr:hypothetical protein [Vibrio nigripulchritudo]CCO46668.1 conserved hypothetical protein [Vibrio nigripulchritudo SOn1]